MKTIIGFLQECNISLKGVILDRGCCTKPVLEYLGGLHLPYIIMVKVLKNLYKALDEARAAIAAGKEPKADSKFSGMINITTKVEDGKSVTNAAINTAQLQKSIDEKGLYSIVSSEEMKPAEVHSKYASRDACETQFRIMKTQLGFGTVRRKPGVQAGTKRGKYNKDGSLRQKPGPKPGSRRKTSA